jgi:hypothetical protein
MNVTHLQLSISDAALMASSDGAYGEVALRASRKFGNPRLSALVGAAHAEMVDGFPSGRLFLDSVEQAMAVSLVKDHAVRHRPVQMCRGGLGSARLRRIKELRKSRPLLYVHRFGDGPPSADTARHTLQRPAPYCGSWSTTPPTGSSEAWFEERKSHYQN